MERWSILPRLQPGVFSRTLLQDFSLLATTVIFKKECRRFKNKTQGKQFKRLSQLVKFRVQTQHPTDVVLTSSVPGLA